jgi:hypothetical protein
MSADENHAIRALHMATRSTWILGLSSALYGLAIIVVAGYFNRAPRFGPYFIAMGSIVWFAPGVLFIASAYYLRRSHRAGAVVAMIVALFQSLCATAILVAFCTLPPISPIPIILSVFWLAALGQLVVHLQRSLRAIHADTSAQPGFALDGPKHVLPVEAEATTEQ